MNFNLKQERKDMKNKKKKTRHSGDESTVGFWLEMKAIYKE